MPDANAKGNPMRKFYQKKLNNPMKTKLLLFITIIGSCSFNIDSSTNITNLNPPAHENKLLSMFEDHLEELGFENKEEIISQFLSTIKNRPSIKKVLTQDNNPIGYIEYRQISYNPRIWQIGNFVIDKEYQNKGYGKQFMQSTLDDIVKRNGDIARVMVLKNNEQARKFYEDKFGFQLSRLNSPVSNNIITLDLELPKKSLSKIK